MIEESLGHDCLFYGAWGPDGTLEGILPLVRVKSLVFGHYLMSMPFLNYGGPLGTPDAVRALAETAVDLARESGARLLELRSREPLPIDLGVSHRKVTVVLELPGTDEALMKVFPAKLRSQVRRPFKEGLTVRFGLDQVEPFYHVFSRHMRDLGTPVMPRAFFERIAAVFGQDVWFGCAYLRDQPVACGAGFPWNGEFEMTWASALSESNRISANMGLYWEFMRRALAEGVHRFNFGRCTPGGGTHRFKRQWGAADEALWWYQHPAGETEATPSPDHGPFAWGPQLWRKLPLDLTTLVGPMVARFLP